MNSFEKVENLIVDKFTGEIINKNNNTTKKK